MSMKKTISQVNKQRIDDLVIALNGIENKIPYILKTVFNFKGRKSPEIAEIAIKKLTEKDDIIYDPFMGSAMFNIASVNAGRKIVSTEIDNYTYYAVYSLLAKIDTEKFNDMLNTLEASVKHEVMELYETSCCGVKNYISKVLFDPETHEYFNPISNRENENGNIKLISKCPICGKKQKQFDENDYKKLEETEKLDTSEFPNDKYIENSRINITSSTGADYYGRIFTNRNKKALLIIQNGINKLEKCMERDVLEHALVSSLSLSRVAMYGSSTDILYHVVPYGAQDMNVWELFESKVKNFLKFKEEYSNVLSENPNNNDKYQIILSSYQDYCHNTSNTFDLIYTDFPYTDQVPYLERNQLYRIWLKHFYNKEQYDLTDEMLSKEIVLSNAPARTNKQKIESYYRDIDIMFSNFNKVLKTNGLIVCTVKLGKNKYFSTLMEIINLARKNGFEYITRIGIDKDDPSLRKQSAYKNTLSNEMIIIFEKLDKANRYWYINNKNYEFECVKLVYDKINKSNTDINITQAVSYIAETILRKEKYCISESDKQIINQTIRDNFVIDKQNAAVRIDSNKLYLDIEDKTDLFTKLYNYIPIFIDKLLSEKGSFVLDDLYFEIANTLCTGDPKTINQFIDDPRHQQGIERLINAYCSTDGKSYERKKQVIVQNDEAIDISLMSGTQFEELIKLLLEADGYHDVIVMGGAGDLGVDLLAKKENSFGKKELYLFQCKRWVADVGSEPMQRLVAERDRRGADIAICVTTSGYTRDGLIISREQDIGAWDGQQVMDKLNLYFPDQYYSSILKCE